MSSLTREMPQLELIRAGVLNRFSVKLKNYELSLRPLSVMEEVRVAEEVAQEMMNRPDNQRFSLTESVMLEAKKIQLASTSAPGQTDYKITETILYNLTPGEIDYLFKQYISGCERLNPSMEKIPADQIEAMVEELKKKPQSMDSALIERSFWELVNICNHLLTPPV